MTAAASVVMSGDGGIGVSGADRPYKPDVVNVEAATKVMKLTELTNLTVADAEVEMLPQHSRSVDRWR